MKNRGEIQIERLIGSLGDGNGPTIIFTAGIHGNEPSGVLALHDVIGMLRANEVHVRGKMTALAGNLSALKKGIRFSDEDLNRMWTMERVDNLFSAKSVEGSEGLEQKELFSIISKELQTNRHPFYFIDLHTTSVETAPFLTINDALINRKFAEKFSIPVILGLEEYLQGPLLSYINELGYVACGFEAGQHESDSAYRNQVAFILQSLVVCGLISPSDLPSYNSLVSSITRDRTDFYEISYRYEIGPEELFSMQPGFTNFESISEGDVLASSNSRSITAPKKGLIFMPLYQAQGDDGFFIINRINRFIMFLSAALRKIRMDSMLTILPGIRWSDDRQALEVDLRIARFFAIEFFHLLGYRSMTSNAEKLVMRNRERVARTTEYKNYI